MIYLLFCEVCFQKIFSYQIYLVFLWYLKVISIWGGYEQIPRFMAGNNAAVYPMATCEIVGGC